MLLRGYQEQALTEIERHYNEGCNRQILSLPTGLGKTVIFTHIHKKLGFHKRVLVIAHRRELVQQIVDHYRKIGYKFGCNSTDTWYENVSTERQIWIATVQSLRRRVTQLIPEEFDLVICDEAHHSVAKSYLSVARHFGIVQRQFKGLFLGVTATPIRNDGENLGQIFDQAVCVTDTFGAINDGWLVPIKYFQAHSRITLNHLHVNPDRDFRAKGVGRLVNQDVRNSLVFRAWVQQAQAKRTIVFCATVSHAMDVAATFRKKDISAEAIHGQLALEERKRILQRHRDGQIAVLANCEILTEGYDDPDVECIIMARPTLSKLMYIQMIGRGLRLPSGISNLKEAQAAGEMRPEQKTQCIIIDVVDNCTRHDLEIVTALSLLGDPTESDNGDAADSARQMPLPPAGGHGPPREVVEAVQAQIEEIDLFATRRRLVEGRVPERVGPQPITEGPLKKWESINWNEEFKKTLHAKIVARWVVVSDVPPYRFERTIEPIFKAGISGNAGQWTLSVKSAESVSYARIFQNLFDAFGCAENFVFDQTQEGGQTPARPRAEAVLPIQKCLLHICNPSNAAAPTFTEASRRIVAHMQRA